MKFNKDINGLRAVAVIAVLLFHFKIPGFSGGFTGVDVFFVISGFLMTKIIFGRLENGSFDIVQFYLERGRRIIPALTALCMFLLGGGWFLLSPTDYELLGKHVLASLAFVSNIVYWTETGYFDTSSYEKFLLHSWSLSIEWQFYIIYPLLVATAVKFINTRWIKITLVFLGLLSLGVSIISSHRWGNTSFFFIHTRAWEMLAGGMLYLYPVTLPKRIRSTCQLIGLGLILLSVFCFTGDDPWPGWLAAVPVVGTMIVMLTSSDESVILTNKLFQWIGKISYSVYLWHWPIVVILNYQNKSGQFFWITSGLLLSFIFGGMSYRFIEVPMRKFKLYKPVRAYNTFWLVTLTYSLITAGGMYVFLNKGVVERFSIMQMTQKELNDEWSLYASNFTTNHDYKNKKVADRIGTTLIVGSSHARDLANALIENGYELGVTSFRSSVCGNFSNAPNLSTKRECDALNALLLKEISEVHYSRIYLHDHWPELNLSNLEDMLIKMRKRTDAPIYVFGPKMTYTLSPLRIIHNGISSDLTTAQEINVFATQYQGISKVPHIKSPREQVNKGLIEFFKKNHWKKYKIYYVDVMHIQCGKKMTCEIISKQDYKPLYFDDNHWTLQGAREFGSKLKEERPRLF